MTDPEFTVFVTRLFVAFPSLRMWLKDNSPDPIATQEIWRTTLRPYTIDECLGVLEAWSTGSLKPFEAYERDKVHLCIRAIISANRDRKAKHDKVDQDAQAYYQARRGPFSVTAHMDVDMKAALVELVPIYGRVRDGAMSLSEYADVKRQVLVKYGIEK